MIDAHTRSIALYALRAGIGMVWIAAAIGKARTPSALLADNVRKLCGGSVRLAAGIARVLPMAELIIGLLLITGWEMHAVSAVSAALFFAFAFLIGRAIVRDSLGDAGCGCFGGRRSPSRGPSMSGPPIVARNFLLAMLSLVVALAGRCACSP
jgi:hypothetical protein